MKIENKKFIKKIAIDISPTIDGNAVRGVGYYTQQLVKSLLNETKSNPNYKNYQIDLIKNTHELQSKKYQLIHYPYFDPFKLTLPQKTNIPRVVTVPDLIPRQFKNHYPVGIKGTIKWIIQKNNLKKSDKIITVSQYSKYIINKIINYPLENIFVTYLGADKNFKPIDNQKKLKEIKNKYSLPQNFVLYVGDINWNKNIPTLVKACLKNKYPLVIVGSAATKNNVPNHPWTQDLLWLQSKTKNHPKITFSNLILTGYIPDKDLPAIFNLSTIYCQPSFAEGFGLPLVQAMQSGVPVVYSQDTCLPEVMGDVGISFNPRSISHLCESLKEVWNHQKVQQKQSLLGLKQAKNFNWNYTAKQTLSVYKQLLNNEK